MSNEIKMGLESLGVIAQRVYFDQNTSKLKVWSRNAYRQAWLVQHHAERVQDLAADKENDRRSAGFVGFEECRFFLDRGWTINVQRGQNGGATYERPKGKAQ